MLEGDALAVAHSHLPHDLTHDLLGANALHEVRHLVGQKVFELVRLQRGSVVGRGGVELADQRVDGVLQV